MCRCCSQYQNCVCQECVKNAIEQLIDEIDKKVQKLDEEEFSKANKQIKHDGGTVLKKIIIAIAIIGVGAAATFILFAGNIGGGDGGGGGGGGGCGKGEVLRNNKCVPYEKEPKCEAGTVLINGICVKERGSEPNPPGVSPVIPKVKPGVSPVIPKVKPGVSPVIP
jgi:tetrahydromethanopterin S-methyltransferase subunit G